MSTTVHLIRKSDSSRSMAEPDQPGPDPAGGPPVLDHPDFRVVESSQGHHLFVTDGSRIYDLDADTARRVEQSLTLQGDDAFVDQLSSTFTADNPRIDGTPLEPPPLRSLSLNVAQGCNLTCSYCYADEGKFGSDAKFMPQHIARASVDRLLTDAPDGADVTVGFMGGEPLLARALVHDTVRYAVASAQRCGKRVKFSLTTNGTTLTEEDAALFAEFDFSISVSVDGPESVNDAQRPGPGGRGSYAKMRRGLDHLLDNRPRHLSARMTATPGTGPLLPLLEHVIDLGVDDAGFAPVLVSPDPAMSFNTSDFEQFLVSMIECGETARRELLAGRRFPFTNFETALHEIHRGSHRPYPCGAGAGYLSVSAEGGLYSCHRVVDDPASAMGSVAAGSDITARREHLRKRHVDSIEPCRGCWARYLCGGGCYHEVDRRGRIACDYIRGWLDFCLQSYAELSTLRPNYFIDPDRYFSPVDPDAFAGPAPRKTTR